MEIESHGIRVEEHIDPVKYLMNGKKVLRGLPLVRIPEKMDGASPSVQSPQLQPFETRTYVTHIGVLELWADLTDFKFETPAEDDLSEFINPIDIIQKVTVPNHSPATVSINLAEVKTLSKSIDRKSVV